MERTFKNKDFMDQLADDTGLAVVVVDGQSLAVSVSNNSSICSALYASPEFASHCEQFCGKAFEAATDRSRPVDFECHAGLQCRAVPLREDGSRFVAIVGRAFVKAENYRRATQKAIDGEWQQFGSGEFFDNVLLTGSAGNIEDAALKLGNFAETQAPEPVELERPKIIVPEAVTTGPLVTGPLGNPLKTDEAGQAGDQQAPPQIGATAELVYAFYQAAVNAGMGGAQQPEKRSGNPEIAVWRSLFGTLMQKDYQSACSLILQFLSGRYGLSSLMWLERREGDFDVITAIGPLQEPLVRTVIAGQSERLIEAATRDVAFALSRGKDGEAVRKLHLSPVTIGGEIRGLVAVEGQIDDEVKRNIQRLCRTLGPQLEILRLRHEVNERDWLSRAIKRFNESLQRIDAEDFCMHVTQISAELLQAERASLLIRDEKSNSLHAKAAVGARVNLSTKGPIGERVAQLALDDGDPIVVADINSIRLGPSPKDWKYKTTSFISYPITIGGRKIAVLNFTDKAGGGAFGERDLEILRSITPQIAVAIDRTAMKDRAGEFEQLSVTDPLTTLTNRRYLERRLEEEIDRSKRHRFPMSLMMLDVDEFKSYNDMFGHPAGDEALRIVAGILKEAVRGEDVAARYGGEEFSILLPQTTAIEAAAIAERIRRQIEKTEFPKRRVTVSIGIASSANETGTPEELINAADSALYEAKNQGRNNVQIFDGLAGSVNSKIH